jgi:hypothetical protein
LHVRKPLDVKYIVLTGRKIQSNSLDPELLTLTRNRPRRWLESTWLRCLGELFGRMPHPAREYFARPRHQFQVHSKAYWGMASGCCRCHRSTVHHAGDVSYTRFHRIKTYHIHRIHIGCCRWVPLTPNISGFACVRAISPRCTRLIWTHGPASILRSWNSNQPIGTSRESALPTFLQSILDSFLSR